MSKTAIKIIIWHVLVALLAWWVWSFNGHVAFNQVTGLDFQPPAVGAFILLTAVMVLGYMLFHQNRRWALSTAGIAGIIFIATFGFNWLNLLGVGLFLLFAILANHRVRQEVQERLKFNIARMLEAGLLPLILGFFILISFAAYQSPFVKDIQKANSLPSQVYVLFQQIIEKTIGPKVATQSPAQQKQILNQIATQTFQSFNSFLKPYFQYAPPVLAFGLFLILWGVAFIFSWLSVLVGLVIFWVLKKTKVVKIEEKDVKAEVLIV
jgi:hypothetical protein